MATISGEIHQFKNKAGTKNWWPRTVTEAIYGLDKTIADVKTWVGDSFVKYSTISNPTSTVDLDDQYIAGNRIQQVSWNYSTASNVANRPTTSGSAASVLVLPNVWGGLQFYTDYNSNVYYIRNRYSSTGWKSWVQLYHTGNFNPADYAKLGTYNNLMFSGNEFTFASAGYNGAIHINFRTASGARDGNISSYHFRNAADGYAYTYAAGYAIPNGTSSQFLKADGGVDSTAYLPLAGGTMSGWITFPYGNGTSFVDGDNVTHSVRPFASFDYDLGHHDGTTWRRIYDSGNLTQSVITGLIGTKTYAEYNSYGYLYGAVENNIFRQNGTETDTWANLGYADSHKGKADFKIVRHTNGVGAHFGGGSMNYGSTLFYGSSDTRGYMSIAYASPLVVFGGGALSTDSASSAPSWYIGIKGTSGTTYDLGTISSQAANGNSAYNSLGNYLPLKAQGETVYRTTSGQIVNLNNSKGANEEAYLVLQSNSTSKAAVGWSTTFGAYIYNYPSAKYLGIKDDGTPHYHGNTLWHAGNFTPSNYLPLAGGTMTGSITSNSNIYTSGTMRSQLTYFLNAAGTDNAGYIGRGSSNDDLHFINYGENSIYFGTKGAKRMTIDSEGYVGIGTTSPSAKLQIASATYSYMNTRLSGHAICLDKLSTNTTGFQNAVWFRRLDASLNIVEQVMLIGTYSSDAYVCTYIAGSAYNNSAIRIDGSGTTATVSVGYSGGGSYKLNVNGQTYSSTGFIAPNTYSYNGIDTGGTVRGIMKMDSNLLMIGNGSSAANYPTYIDGGTFIRFRIGTGHGTLATMTSSGLGINTTSPTYSLDVTGSTRITGKLILPKETGTSQLAWWNGTYRTWITYLSGVSGSTSPTGAAMTSGEVVTSWSMRSLIQNFTGYGWVWESCAESANATSTIMMELSSNTGVLRVKGGIYSNGYVSALGTASSSDAKLKDDITTISYDRAKEVLSALNPREWTWNSMTSKEGERGAGMVAQEVESILPDTVKEIGGNLTLEYNTLFAYGLAMTKYLVPAVESLEERVARLERENEELKRQLTN